MEILRFIITMVIMILGEMCCTMYIVATEERKALRASLYCAGIVLISSVLTINYVDDKLMLVATIIGAFIGTFIVVRIKA